MSKIHVKLGMAQNKYDEVLLSILKYMNKGLDTFNAVSETRKKTGITIDQECDLICLILGGSLIEYR
jgi:hypothetical protein|nr:MAG TPA: hypothetical protein [Caudoviricetes sp.]